MARNPTTQTVDASLEVERTNADGTVFAYSLTVSCKYYPGRPPPPCSDHDHPNFSDPGDGAECEIESITIDDVVDDEGESVPETDARRLKSDALNLTQSEEESVEQSAASHYSDYDGPDPDEAYERWRDRQDDL